MSFIQDAITLAIQGAGCGMSMSGAAQSDLVTANHVSPLFHARFSGANINAAKGCPNHVIRYLYSIR